MYIRKHESLAKATQGSALGQSDKHRDNLAHLKLTRPEQRDEPSVHDCEREPLAEAVPGTSAEGHEVVADPVLRGSGAWRFRASEAHRLQGHILKRVSGWQSIMQCPFLCTYNA